MHGNTFNVVFATMLTRETGTLISGVYLKPEEAKPLSPKLTNSWHKVTKGLNKGFKKS